MVGLIARASTLVCIAFFALNGPARGADKPSGDEIYGFDDQMLAEPLEHPDWFKKSFLDLGADLNEALEAGKRGIMVYFGQRRCAYCQKLMQVNFGMEDIVEYTQANFDVIPIDIWGVDEVTDMKGEVLTERQFSEHENTVFTPSILFYNDQRAQVLRLRGYYPPYQFRAALEYVADGHYKRESFRDFLARGDNRMVFEEGDLNEEPFFASPPYNLDRRVPSERPLAVFFEQGDCHACDVLHGQSLREPAINRYFADLDAVQLDMWADTPVITPSGERTTARKWATELGLFYTPSILLFDERGNEILRVDSVVAFYRLRNVLNYIASKAYLTETFQQWRVHRGF